MSERVLVVANEVLEGEGLIENITEHVDPGSSELFVVAPVLVDSAVKHHMGDVDSAKDPARERLEKSLRRLREAGYQAEGELGDADPVVATSDEVIKLRPDRIVVVAHPDEDAAYAEQGLGSRLEEHLDQPVTEILVQRNDGASEIVGVEKTSPVAGRAKGRRPDRNFPPLTKRDLFGIAVAVFGTIAVGVLAALTAANGSEHDGIDAAAPAALLIALALALINLAHIVGLFLFQSVRYRGLFEKVFAR